MSTPIFDTVRMNDILFSCGVDSSKAVYADSLYCIPNGHWFLTTFANKLSVVREALQMRYEENAEDCDDFARMVVAYAQFIWKRTMDRPSKTALAVCEFWYDSPGGKHAIVGAITSGNEEFKMLFLEPQNGRQLFLTPTERASCFFPRF